MAAPIETLRARWRIDVHKEEIARRIRELNDEQRAELYRLCAERKRLNRNGANVAVYEAVSEEMAAALQQQNLIWFIGPTVVAARHDVYEYWEEKVSVPQSVH